MTTSAPQGRPSRGENPPRDSAIEADAAVLGAVLDEVSRVVVGQRVLLERMMLALLTGGHVLLEGVPGLAKSLAVETLARATGLDWRRIQFTPDLLPADVVGTMVFQPSSGRFETRLGPIFANLILADEVNRAPAKVHSALLEAMQERKVTIGDQTNPLPEPFHVLATQNPLEHEGTYELPEAGLDRFLFKVVLDYPSREDECRIVLEQARTAPRAEVRAVADAGRILAARRHVDAIHVEPRLVAYVVELVRATRDPAVAGLADLSRAIRCGASPRAAISLLLAARAHALLRGKTYAAPSDVKVVALDVLRHRVQLRYDAEADGMTAQGVLEKILDAVPVP
jgi:MoxR-like ATPase